MQRFTGRPGTWRWFSLAPAWRCGRPPCSPASVGIPWLFLVFRVSVCYFMNIWCKYSASVFHFAVQAAKSFPPSAPPIVDNFSCLPRKRLTHIYATKNQNPRYVVKHIFAHSRLFVLRLDKKWVPLHSLIDGSMNYNKKRGMFQKKHPPPPSS